MSQPSTTNPKQRATLMAVGGFVVGASAMAALIGLHNVFHNDKSASLRGYSSSATPEFDTSNDKVSSMPMSSPSPTSTPEASSEQDIFSASIRSMNSTAIPTPAPSSSNISPFPTSYMPTPETLMPTDYPTHDTTEAPTELEDDAPDDLFKRQHLRSKEVGFRLKLYWEEGYFWQERTEEKWWCMSCPDGKCERSHKMELRNCKKRSDRDATFVVTSYGNNGGHQFRVANTDLCLQKMGDRRAIKLKPCRVNKSVQLFADFKPDEKFDLRPVDYTDRCLSNHHHPKAGETIYAETCKKAHRTDTGYWVAY